MLKMMLNCVSRSARAGTCSVYQAEPSHEIFLRDYAIEKQDHAHSMPKAFLYQIPLKGFGGGGLQSHFVQYNAGCTKIVLDCTRLSQHRLN